MRTCSNLRHNFSCPCILPCTTDCCAIPTGFDLATTSPLHGAGGWIAKGNRSGSGVRVTPGAPAGARAATMVAQNEQDFRASTPAGLEVANTGRVQCVALFFGEGRVLHLLNLYGMARGGAAAAAFNESPPSQALVWLAGLGGVPCLLMRDLNFDLSGSTLGCGPYVGMARCGGRRRPHLPSISR